MASFSTRKPCATSNDCIHTPIFTCEGCSKAFCAKHAVDHRRLLGEEIDEIINEHDHLNNSLVQLASKSKSHPLIKQIDEWEKASIAKIRIKANEARQELLQLTAGHTAELLKQLQQISEPLRWGQEHEAFIEMDLRQWKETLEELKADFTSPLTISIHQHETVPLISDFNISSKVANDLFDRVFSSTTRIEENGQVVVHDSPGIHTEIRVKNDYTWGCHQVRLCIEAASNNWIFLGINSKLSPLQEKSYASKSSNGWSSNNYVWSNGQGAFNDSNAPIKMQTNDIITLTFDCDNRTISMINERTNSKYEMFIDIKRCPLPWQLHAILHRPADCLRILPI